MIACEVFRRSVDAVVDGEVDPTTQIEIEQHLSECGPCRVHLAFARAFKMRVKEAVLEGTAPPAPDLRDRIVKALDAEDRRRAAAQGGVPIGAAEGRGPLGLAGVKLVPVKARYAVPAAAAAVALAVLAAREGGNPDGLAIGEAAMDPTSAMNGASYLEDVVERHWREHPVEVSGPPTQIASWFRGKLEFPVRPIEFARPDVRLVGARISSVRDRDAAAFFYDVHGRRVTVMVFEGAPPLRRGVHQVRIEGRGVMYGTVRGYTVPVVEHDGLTYAIAGDLDGPSLLHLAATARVRDR